MFVRVRNSAKGANAVGSSQSMYYQCTQCKTIHLQPVQVTDSKGKQRPPRLTLSPTCDECGGQFQVGGPIWTAPMADPEFVKELRADMEAGIDKGAPAGTTAGAGAGSGAGAGAGAASADVKTSVHTTLGCDAGSNSEETVEQSRKRLTGLLRAYELEVCCVLPLLCPVLALRWGGRHTHHGRA